MDTNGGGAVREGNNSVVKCSSENISAEFHNGDEGSVGNIREDVCLAGCESHVRKRQKISMGGPHGGTIGKAEEDSMSGGDQIGTGSCGAK